jgi:glycerol-3-phosphate dehydrogenase (NAD(P)+)
MARIAILGAGSWGTALAVLAARAGNEGSLWTRDANIADAINTARRNPRFAHCEIPPHITAGVDLASALRGAELVVPASPSHAQRALLESIRQELPTNALLVNAAKGIESDSLMRMSEVAAQIFGSPISARHVTLSGPSFAREAVADHPTAVSAASVSPEAAGRVQLAFSSGNFRVYTNDDVVGTEIGGAVKNVVAIAAGMVSGLGLGHNSLAALITRGLAEIGRLTEALGGKRETLMGLAGLGDLVLTCTGDLSRNRQVGFELARGRSLAEITGAMSEVAEGIRTTSAVHALAEKHGIEMPITAEVFAVLYHGKPAKQAAEALMGRPLRAEH